MDFREKEKYLEIHPVKLVVDVSIKLISSYFSVFGLLTYRENKLFSALLVCALIFFAKKEEKP